MRRYFGRVTILVTILVTGGDGNDWAATATCRAKVCPVAGLPAGPSSCPAAVLLFSGHLHLSDVAWLTTPEDYRVPLPQTLPTGFSPPDLSHGLDALETSSGALEAHQRRQSCTYTWSAVSSSPHHQNTTVTSESKLASSATSAIRQHTSNPFAHLGLIQVRRMIGTMKESILVTNDDGINAPGIQALIDTLVASNICDVWVCAPDQ